HRGCHRFPSTRVGPTQPRRWPFLLVSVARGSAADGCAPERRGDRGQPAVDQARHRRSEVAREQVRDPHEPCPALALGEHLRRGVVVAETERAVAHRPDQAFGLLVAVDQQLASDRPVEERDHAVVAVELAVDDEARHETQVHGPPVAHRIPHVTGVRIERDLLVDRSHRRYLAWSGVAELELPPAVGGAERSSPMRARGSWTFLRACDTRAMLHARTLLSGEGVTISDVSCRHARGPGAAELHTGPHSLVFVRRGCFVRTADGAEAVLDPTVAYCVNPGEEQRYDHPHEHGDDCTVLAIDEPLLGELPGGPERLPTGALPAPPEADLEHRMLVSLVGAGGDE